MALEAIKRVRLKAHHQTFVYTVIINTKDPEYVAIRAKYTYHRKTTSQDKYATYDSFTDLEKTLSWLEDKMLTKMSEGFALDIEKSFSIGAAREYDTQLGNEELPEGMVSAKDLEYTRAKEGDYIVCSPTNISPYKFVPTVTLEVREQWVYAVGKFNEKWLRNKLSYYVEGSKFSKKAKSCCFKCDTMEVSPYWCAKCNKSMRPSAIHECGTKASRDWCRKCKRPTKLKSKWDGRVSLFDRRLRRFPVGLRTIALRFLLRSGYIVRIRDTRDKPMPDENRAIMVHGLSIDSRPYQVKAVKRMLKKGGGLLHLATNSGKTVIAGAFMYKLNKPTLMLVHGRELLEQQQKRLTQMLGEKVGFIGTNLKGKKIWDPRKFTVASISTMHRGLTGKDKKKIQMLLNSVDCLIVDEAHHTPSSTWYKVITACPAYYRFGLSGTALDRGDKQDIKTVACYGPVISKLNNQYLVHHGHSAKPHISLIEVPPDQFKLPKDEEESWYNTETYGIIKNEWRNRAIAAKAREYFEHGRATLIMVNQERHSREIMRHLDDDLRAIDISSDSPNREQAALDFKAGKLPCLVTTPLFDEGIDIEGIDAIILAGGGKSTIKVLQRLGRGMRLKPKPHQAVNEAILWVTDFVDNHHSILARHCLERLAIYKSQDCFAIVRETVDIED
jgi:superfamily II DNA or RNA helicase